MRTDELDFHLPGDLIAQVPTPDRAASRLLHYKRRDRSVEHRHFSDLPALLVPGDLLVFNDARVLQARFMLRKETGGFVEGLFVAHLDPSRWRVMLKSLGNYGSKPLRFELLPELEAKMTRVFGGGEYEIAFDSPTPAIELLDRIGRMPLPPYIKREKGRDSRDEEDRLRYQTVYAKTPGAVAAPTAGLHFTPELFEQLDRAGIERMFVTLHVGLGTFKPVTAQTLAEHAMFQSGIPSLSLRCGRCAESRESGRSADRRGGNDVGARAGESIGGRAVCSEDRGDFNFHLSALSVEACRRDDHELSSAPQHTDRDDRGAGWIE